jgi:uncharacterized membrane protein YdjX (TVP38/TMEM64 family)
MSAPATGDLERAPALTVDLRAVRGRLLAGAALLAGALVAARALHIDDLLSGVSALARDHGALGVLVHALAYVPAALLGLPVAPLTVAAGLSYGPVGGALVAVPATALSSSLAFLAGRRLALDPVALASGTGRVARAARAIGSGGLRVVLLLRLLPVAPWSVLNFAFGAVPCRYADFLVGTVLGTIPTAVAYAWVGAALGR